MPYPVHRLRRLKRTPAIRRLLAESVLSPQHLVQPIIIGDMPHGEESLNGSSLITVKSISTALKQVEALLPFGISTVFLQAFPDEKDSEATAAWAEHGLMQQAIQAIKEEFGDDCTVISEVTLRHASRFGEEGVVIDKKVINDPTAERLVKVALAQAEAGADFVCPTDMMDGRTLFIRDHLDDEGFDDTGIITNSVKFCSGLHDSTEAPLSSGSVDVATYQSGISDKKQALQEVIQDSEEGSDALMLSPASLSTDLLASIKSVMSAPVCVYQTASEAAMIECAATRDWFDDVTIATEQLIAYKRAGADFIVSFYSQHVVKQLTEDND